MKNITPNAAANNTRSTKDGSFMWMSRAIVRSHLRHLSPPEFAVYALLAAHIDTEEKQQTQTVSVAQKVLAEESGYQQRCVREALEKLAGRGYIEVLRNRRGNGYRLLRVAPDTGTTVPLSAPRHRHHGAALKALIEPLSLKGRKDRKGPERPPAEARPGASSPEPIDWKVSCVKDAIDSCYREANPDREHVPWGKRSLWQVRRVVESLPRISAQEWVACVEHRFASDDAIPGVPPQYFVLDLPRYLGGPLNRFHLLRDGPSGYNPDEGDRTRRNRRSAEQAIANIREKRRTGRVF